MTPTFIPHLSNRIMRNPLKELNEDLEAIVSWSECNSLVLNPLKQNIYSSVPKRTEAIKTIGDVIVMGQPIERVYEELNLGFIMDSELC